jgi:cytochrome b involved in lipid metabolism
MKLLSTVSLFIFGVVLTAVLTAGLVFYQNNKNNQVSNSKVGSKVSNAVNQLTSSGKNIILNMEEISKHNNQNNCWLLIDGKVYDITSYFGSHPGGNSTMSPTCGVDATAAYATRDPNAKKSSGNVKHSADARNMLNDYYLGNLNQSIGVKNNPTTNSNTQTNDTITNSITKPEVISVIKPIVAPVGNLTLNITEISKHNKSTDCWLLISGKVYNITSYFGSHPGGNSPMSATCGEDATAEYATKNSSATNTTGGNSHSANALSMLSNYFIGNLNQTIGAQNITQTNAVVAPIGDRGDDDDEWDD